MSTVRGAAAPVAARGEHNFPPVRSRCARGRAVDFHRCRPL